MRRSVSHDRSARTAKLRHCAHTCDPLNRRAVEGGLAQNWRGKRPAATWRARLAASGVPRP
jgi:hypothetical protein